MTCTCGKEKKWYAYVGWLCPDCDEPYYKETR